MLELILIGLLCNLIGALTLLVPRTRLRRIIQYFGSIGRLEHGRIVLFERRREVTEADTSFEELRDALLEQKGESAKADEVYKISLGSSSDNIRLHLEDYDRIVIESPNRIEQQLGYKIDETVYVIGASLLFTGFAFQLVGQALA